MALNTVSTPVNLPAWDPRLTGSLKSNGNKAEDDAKLKKACQEMESVFLNMLLKTMRDTLPKSELGGNTQRTETMQSMTRYEDVVADDGEVDFFLPVQLLVPIAEFEYGVLQFVRDHVAHPQVGRGRHRAQVVAGMVVAVVVEIE